MKAVNENGGIALEEARAFVRRALPEADLMTLPEEALDSFIISTIGSMDFPFTPSVLGTMDFGAYMGGITPEFQQAERDAVINCSLADIKALAPYVRAILADNNFCTVGSGVKIEEEKDLFDHIENL